MNTGSPSDCVVPGLVPGCVSSVTMSIEMGSMGGHEGLTTAEAERRRQEYVGLVVHEGTCLLLPPFNVPCSALAA